jgi:hypothetical protein
MSFGGAFFILPGERGVVDGIERDKYMLSEMVRCGRRGLHRKELRCAFHVTSIAAPDMTYRLILIAQFDKEGSVRPNPALPALYNFSSQQILLDEATVLPGNLRQIFNSRARR